MSTNKPNDETRADEDFMRPMSFDESPIEVPVSIQGKKYVLREASGDAARKYHNAVLSSTQLGPEGKPSRIKGMADVEPLLVSNCLFSVDDEGQQVPVLLQTILDWPARVQKGLFERIKDISDLVEEGEVEELEKALEKAKQRVAAAKNDSSSTRDGFD